MCWFHKPADVLNFHTLMCVFFFSEKVLPSIHANPEYPCELVGTWNTWYGEQDQAGENTAHIKHRVGLSHYLVVTLYMCRHKPVVKDIWPINQLFIQFTWIKVNIEIFVFRKS